MPRINIPPQLHSMVSGACAGLVASIVTCPLDVLKTSLQASSVAAGSAEYEGVQKTAGRIWRQAGLRGFYRGLGPTLAGYLPTWGIYFTVYDLIKDRMGVWASDPCESYRTNRTLRIKETTASRRWKRVGRGKFQAVAGDLPIELEISQVRS